MKTWLLTIMVVFVADWAAAQESISLTTPIPSTVPARSSFEPMKLEITISPNPEIRITLRANDGKDEIFLFPCTGPLGAVPEGCPTDTPAETLALINALNTANLATRSLWRRVFDRLVAEFPSRFPGGATVQ